VGGTAPAEIEKSGSFKSSFRVAPVLSTFGGFAPQMTRGSDTRSMTDVLLADEDVPYNDGLTRMFRAAIHAPGPTPRNAWRCQDVAVEL
jgi:hypothetical protein